MTIPLLLVCDGAESKQASLEGLVKNEPGLKYIATVSMQEGIRAVERAVKVGAKLIWIDLDEEPVEGLNLLAETRKLHPMLSVIVSRTQIDPDMVRAALQLGALDFLDPSRATQQLHVVVENLSVSAQQAQAGVSHAADTAAQLPALPAQNPNPAPSLANAGGGKWSDLDSIPTPGAKALPPAGQDVTGEIHVANSGIQNLVVSQSAQAAPAAPAAVHPTAELPAGGSKWGDLDSIGAISAPAAAPAAPMPAAAAQIQAPAAPMPAPAAQIQAPAAPMPAPAAQIQAPAAPMPAPAAAMQAPAAPMPAPAPANPEPSNAAAGGANNFNGGKWGDLDAIPTPKAALEPAAPKATAEIAKPLSDLDAIPSPGALAAPAAPATPLPRPEPHHNTNKALRPSPEKAESFYSMGSPVMMAVVIIVIIFGAIAFMLVKQHNQPATQPTIQQTIQPTIQPTSQPTVQPAGQPPR